MDTVRPMLDSHPRGAAFDPAQLAECIEACYQCAQSCTACADACLGEPMVQEMVGCIRLDLDCFDGCVTTGNLLSRQTEPNREILRAQLQACATACRICGAECASHGDQHEHCRLCSDACRRCEEACNRLLQAG